MAERIIGVAIQLQDKKYTYVANAPCRHHHVIRMMTRYGVSVGDIANATQGFLALEIFNAPGERWTRFVDRYEAALIAKNAGQLVRPLTGSEPQELYSENLWIDTIPVNDYMP